MSEDKKTQIFIKKEWCKSCGICFAFCPKEVLQPDELGKAVVVHPDKCIGCKICELHCPDFVITVEKEENNENGQEKASSR
ncbi:MAG: 2-oxoglutarate ferredoxin oxidoreductase subunit delta [Clostridia bacterium]|jgi:2-oxoglutarate ferredoxin oxidoreductase subunit delta|nr:hypothetical protein [Clostridiales bacterium]MDK2984810.1 2-oxoglutarate ferredoxin oxidoreductase subunit delta [Clostridia bacterium]